MKICFLLLYFVPTSFKGRKKTDEVAGVLPSQRKGVVHVTKVVTIYLRTTKFERPFIWSMWMHLSGTIGSRQIARVKWPSWNSQPREMFQFAHRGDWNSLSMFTCSSIKYHPASTILLHQSTSMTTSVLRAIWFLTSSHFLTAILMPYLGLLQLFVPVV